MQTSQRHEREQRPSDLPFTLYRTKPVRPEKVIGGRGADARVRSCLTSCARCRCRRARTRPGDRSPPRPCGRPWPRRAGPAGRCLRRGCPGPCLPCAGCAWRPRLRPFAQSGVGGRAAVAGNDLKRGVAAEGLFEPVEKVEELRVHAADLPGVVVAQEMVEFFQGLGNVLVPHGVDDAQLLAGVRMLEGQAARPGLFGRAARAAGAWQRTMPAAARLAMLHRK
jgi:hypothetical protein